ncbi:MAG: hypothetical protein PVI21_04950 [Candidatus Woesebacteria bacterium]|jgi:hypothetical protein
MSRKVESILENLINQTSQLAETTNGYAKNQIGGIVDELVAYIDTAMPTISLSQSSLDKINLLQEKYGAEKHNQIHKSKLIDMLIVSLGKSLLNTLEQATRVDEIELLIEQIGAYTLLISYYGDATQRVSESMGINLGEAAAFKLHELKSKKTSPLSETQNYIDTFKSELHSFEENTL